MKRLLALLIGSLAGICVGQSIFDIKVNEVLASGSDYVNPQGNPYDRIELFNPTDSDVSLAGAALGDRTTYAKYLFPDNALVPAHGFYVVDLDPDNTNHFHLNRAGDTVFLGLNLGGRGNPMAYFNWLQYGQQLSGMSVGRVPDGGDGTTLLASRSLGAPNTAVAALGDQTTLLINEWLANPPNNDNDYIEIYNPGDAPVDLGGMKIENGRGGTTNLPPLTLVGVGRTNGFILFKAMGDKADEGDELPFKLSSDADAVALLLNDNTLVNKFEWGPGKQFPAQEQNASTGRAPDGSTNFLTFKNHLTPGAPNLSVIANIIVNELLTHTDPPLEDAVELYNPTDQAVNIGNWYLGGIEWWKDEKFEDKQLKRYKFPPNTMVPARGYFVVYESQFRNNVLDNNFTFNSAHGGSLFLSRADTSGNIVAFLERTYPAAANGVSFGRITNSDGDVDFVAMECLSFGANPPFKTPTQFATGRGAPNLCGPKWGPIIINEVMYDGTNTTFIDEYIELHNTTGSRFALFDPQAQTNGWKLRGGLSYTFDNNDFIDANGYMLLVPFDPFLDTAQLDAFRTAYGIPDTVPVRGPYNGRLENSDDVIELSRPDPPQGTNHVDDVGFVPYILIDRVHYETKSPWPTNSQHTGLSLQRAIVPSYADEPKSWRDDVPTPGAMSMVHPVSIVSHPQTSSVLQSNMASFTVTVQGSDPSFRWVDQNGKPLPKTLPVTIVSGPDSSTLYVQANRKTAGAKGRGFSVIVTNLVSNERSSAAWLTNVIPVKIVLPKAAVTLTKPAGTKKLTLTGKATGTGPLQYQWWFTPAGPNNGPVALTTPSATTSKLVLENLNSDMSGQYFVTVSNSLSGGTSPVVTLNVP